MPSEYYGQDTPEGKNIPFNHRDKYIKALEDTNIDPKVALGRIAQIKKDGKIGFIRSYNDMIRAITTGYLD